jgi:hypothetical protein
VPGGPRGLQNRWRFVYQTEVGSIPTLSALIQLRLHKDNQCPFSKPLSQAADKAWFPNLTMKIHGRVDSTQAEVFEGGDDHVAGADLEADLAFIVCGVSF